MFNFDVKPIKMSGFCIFSRIYLHFFNFVNFDHSRWIWSYQFQSRNPQVRFWTKSKSARHLFGDRVFEHLWFGAQVENEHFRNKILQNLQDRQHLRKNYFYTTFVLKKKNRPLVLRYIHFFWGGEANFGQKLEVVTFNE